MTPLQHRPIARQLLLLRKIAGIVFAWCVGASALACGSSVRIESSKYPDFKTPSGPVIFLVSATGLTQDHAEELSRALKAQLDRTSTTASVRLTRSEELENKKKLSAATKGFSSLVLVAPAGGATGPEGSPNLFGADAYLLSPRGGRRVWQATAQFSEGGTFRSQLWDFAKVLIAKLESDEFVKRRGSSGLSYPQAGMDSRREVMREMKRQDSYRYRFR